MMRVFGLCFAVLVACVVSSISANAAPIVPHYQTFGAPPATVTYGGSGIPTNPSVIVNGSDQNGATALYGVAHQRYDNPALANDGAGTYFAMAGADMSAQAQAGYAKWNFGFEGITSSGDYSYLLFYDTDPGAGTDLADHGMIWFDTSVQNSWNLGMGFLQLTVPGVITAPTYGAFDPNAAGRYTFMLAAYSPNLLGSTGTALPPAAFSVGWEVCVNDGQSCPGTANVPEPASMLLLGMGVIGLGVARRR